LISGDTAQLWVFLMLATAILFPGCQAPPEGTAQDPTPTGELASLRKRAEGGDRDAQRDLAFRYLAGGGVERDLALARKWYGRAADQGETHAAYMAGLFTTFGVGGGRDLDRARAYLEPAAQQGNAEASRLLADLREQRLEEPAFSFEWFGPGEFAGTPEELEGHGATAATLRTPDFLRSPNGCRGAGAFGIAYRVGFTERSPSEIVFTLTLEKLDVRGEPIAAKPMANGFVREEGRFHQGVFYFPLKDIEPDTYRITVSLAGKRLVDSEFDIRDCEASGTLD
jgi:hypothetical protein